MNSYQKIKQALTKDWYIQGFNGVPIFLNTAAYSGMSMKKYHGFGYTQFIASYQNGYGEIFYSNDDFKRLWKIIEQKIKHNPNYLKLVRNKFLQVFVEYEADFHRLDKQDITKLSDAELLKLLKRFVLAQRDSTSVAHIIEPISLYLEDIAKQKLSQEISDQKLLNKYFALLTTPTKPSFIAREENDLRKIALLSNTKKEIALDKHIKKYHWVGYSYLGPKLVERAEFVKRMNSLGKLNPDNRPAKRQLIKELKLSRELKTMISTIDFVTGWQDERKSKILTAVSYLGKVIEEISRRLEVDKQIIYYLDYFEALELPSINEIKKLSSKLSERIKGVVFLIEDKESTIISGSDFARYILDRKSLAKKNEVNQDIHGSIANAGTAQGRVVICKSIDSINKVQTGDIVVASMTRPEYLPALKKAAAIVTDEGGITCHAAIVARELNIPCIIGTKIATQILKDGMTVEVRANHGIVRIV